MFDRLRVSRAAALIALMGLSSVTAMGGEPSPVLEPGTSAGAGTIVDIAVGDPNFSELVAALKATNLVATLQGAGPFTVFAPTNAAFNLLNNPGGTLAAPSGALAFFLDNPAILKQVLLYHVESGFHELYFDLSGRPLTTVQGEKVFPQVDFGPNGWRLKINNSHVIVKPIVASNGIIYVIDSVLLPQFTP